MAEEWRNLIRFLAMHKSTIEECENVITICIIQPATIQSSSFMSCFHLWCFVDKSFDKAHWRKNSQIFWFSKHILRQTHKIWNFSVAFFELQISWWICKDNNFKIILTSFSKINKHYVHHNYLFIAARKKKLWKNKKKFLIQ